MGNTENLKIYEECRSVPQEAQKKIQGGRLNGKTDINPMWRIKKLTEIFGPVGKGWYALITERWTENGAGGEVTANIRINLFVKYDNDWSQPIEGVGGSLLIAKETAGLRTDDDAFKKAYTDAISVACKAIGIGADVYWEKDPTKYTQNGEESNGAGENVKPIKTAQKQPKNAPKMEGSPQAFKPITKDEILRVWGVKNVEETIVWFEGKFGVEFANWGEEETDMARMKLAEKKKKREAEEQRKKGMARIDDSDLPFSMGD